MNPNSVSGMNNNNGSHVNNLSNNPSGSGSPASISMLGNKPDNVWIETKAENGKPYYYHARTRETSWNKPESALVLTQEQFNASLQQQMAQRPPFIPGVGESMNCHVCHID